MGAGTTAGAGAVPLRLVDVTRVYGVPPRGVTALDHVDLEVRAGEVVVVVGPSGSGKTTLLSVAGCILRPTEGRVEVMGTAVERLGERQLPAIRARHLGFVFQSFNLLAPLTVFENVLIAMNLAGHRGHAARARVTELLAALDLSDRAGWRPRDLSGGEQQRVAIARALANRPDLILADEPTASLDGATGARVMQRLAGAVRDGQARALVVVTHDQRILDAADRVLTMEDGRLSGA
jgi:putative ABC transport system ATP-binding protein